MALLHRPGPLDREILALAVPALGALAVDPLVTIIDTAFVGRLGVVPLAALGIDASIFSLAFVVFNFLAYGTTPRVARALGRNDPAEAGRVAVQALVVAIGGGLVAAGLLITLAGPLVGVMGASGEVVAPAVEYLRIRALAGPAVLLVMAGHGVFRGHHDTRTPLLVTLALNAINLVLDPFLIFGLGWGLAGAAWATVAAQWTGAAGFAWLILGPRRTAMGVEIALPSPRDLVPFLRIGVELLVRTLSLIATLALATAVAARIGTVAVAAHQVASQVWLLLALVLDSLAVAAQAMIARHRGAGDAVAARATGRRLLRWGVAVGLANAGVIALLRPWIPRFFTPDPAAIEAIDRVLPFVVAMQPLNALVFVWDGIFLGAERFRYLAVQMVVSAAVAAAILLLVVPLGWGLRGVWWGIVALMAARAATLAAGWRGVGPVPAVVPAPDPDPSR